jgi:hypothetical protein
MNQDNLADVDGYIKQSRNAGASDGQILDELIRAGWDRNIVLGRLSSDKATIPNIANEPAQVFRNSSGLDNVQVVNTKGDSTQSRIGIVSYFFTGSILVLGYTIVAIINNGLSTLFPSEQYPNLMWGAVWSKYSLVIALSAFVPALIAFILSEKKIKKTFSENPGATEDVYYKKNIRSSLKLALLVTAYMVFRLGFAVFGSIFLDTKVEVLDYVDIIISLITISFISYIFWGYSRKTYK